MTDLLRELQLDGPSKKSITDNNKDSTLQSNSFKVSNNNINEGWILCPMTPSDPSSTSLGRILKDILVQTRQQRKGNVVFLGMDCPELPLEEIVGSLDIAGVNGLKNYEEVYKYEYGDTRTSTLSSAFICPANDGGYGMLCVPPQAPADAVFKGIRWSDRLTALGQIKALTDCGIPVRLGRVMNDIDEPEDVHALCQRLSERTMKVSQIAYEPTETGAGASQTNQLFEDDADVLSRSSTDSGAAQTGDCQYTIRALIELNLLK